MYRVTLSAPDDFDGWRTAARSLALANVSPDTVSWGMASDGGLFDSDAPPPAPPGGAFGVPKDFVSLAQAAILHSDPERFALLYALLAKVRAKPGAMQDKADPLLARIGRLAQAVRRDIHKMRAFVRFREVENDGDTRFVAWFEPEHHIVRANAAFFVRRFANMRWSILTPEVCIHWNGETLSEGPGAERGDAPADDPIENVWKSYYAAIFNPARLKVGAMLSEMPMKYWHNLPEAALIPELIAGAQAREAAMIAASPKPVAPAPMSKSGNAAMSWEALRTEAMACTRCPLHAVGTQTIFGEGPIDAPLMFVGEQPGDQEDRAGRPFVGPAGQLFDAVLAQVGLDRTRAYVTNAVKHFKHEQRGKRRIHQTPVAPEIEACRWWLSHELDLLQPRIIVALGATAARAILGKAVTISRVRGAPVDLGNGTQAWITVHPSYLLRIPDADKAQEERTRFIADLTMVRTQLEALG